MGGVSDVRKAFEDSLRRVDELIESMKAERDRIKAEFERVKFVVSGSRVHFMRNILGKGESPLFGHFVIIEVGPLSKEYALELFMKKCKV
jgi:uroporphyrinogen-III synthase